MAADRRAADGAATRTLGAALLRAVLLRGCPRQPVVACRRSRTSGACRGTVSSPDPAAHRHRQARDGSPARRSGGPAAVPRHPLLPGRTQPPDAALPADAELLAVRGRRDTPARSGPRKLANRTPPAALSPRRRRFRPGAIAGPDRVTASIAAAESKRGGESACRPGSVRPLARGGGHPSGTAVAGSLVRSTREHRTGRPRSLAQGTAGSPLDLAPGGVYRAAAVTCGAGGLLHRRFTLTLRTRTRGGLFSVALSRGSPRVGVTDHPALWSPDLPHRA